MKTNTRQFTVKKNQKFYFIYRYFFKKLRVSRTLKCDILIYTHNTAMTNVVNNLP